MIFAMELTDTYKGAESVISTEMDGESVLMHVMKGKYYTLNETGSLIWKKLEGGSASLGEMMEMIGEEFEVDEATCRKDLEELLKSMEKKGILERVS